jgi:hypothetical protein
MPAPLPVGKILAGAFLIPWWNRKAFVRALAFPLALLATLMLSWYFTDALLANFVKFLLCVAYAALFTLFAVTCHRLVLLDPAAVARNPVPSWSRREGLFFGWMVGAWLLFLVVFLVTLAIAVNALGMVFESVRTSPAEAFGWLETAARMPALYVFARLSPLFPATAVDRKVDLKWAWRLTRGNGLRLMLIVGFLPWALSYVPPLLYRSEATALETILLTVAGIALFAVEIAALSISYRELTKEG